MPYKADDVYGYVIPPGTSLKPSVYAKVWCWVETNAGKGAPCARPGLRHMYLPAHEVHDLIRDGYLTRRELDAWKTLGDF